MTSSPHPEDLPTLPADLSDRLLAILFGDPERRSHAFAALVAEHPAHAAVLQAHHDHHAALEAGPTSTTADTTTIPGYRLFEVLGEGGMGTVHRAEQLQPVQRPVAVKVIKPGMDSKVVLARFQQERQALAAMDHDAIARIFDCGTTSRGQPFFAMELVDGLPIHRYCDVHRLSLRDRLELFAQVCRGVQHAHQKGVVHRDLKPGNVLVAAREGGHAVKIIDFGVARAIDRRREDGSLFTEQGMILGTPEYMSPEQAAGNVARVDTRTDVYSLGVILYELLVGELPFPSAELRALAFAEVQRRLRDDDPPKPSTRLSTLGAAATECAAQRGLTTEALRRELAGDLDWLVWKAMAKEPERRYESATALADDVRRYLAHEPLVAGPPSAGYRLRKFVRRHRGRVFAGTAVFVTAVVGAVVALQFALREQAKVREFDLLSGVVLYERALAAEKELYPPWPHKIEAMEKWLREDCGRLLAMRPEMERSLLDWRRRASGETELARQQRIAAHPRFQEREALARSVASLQRAHDIRRGVRSLEKPALLSKHEGRDVATLQGLAWRRICDKFEEREKHGEEAYGLVLARAAVASAANTPQEAEALNVLAWALVANGQDGEALRTTRRAVGLVAQEQREDYLAFERQIDAAIRGRLAALEQTRIALSQLQADIDAAPPSAESVVTDAEGFLHREIEGLLDKLVHLENREKWEVEQRLQWARRIGLLSMSHPRARHTWAEARDAIARADGQSASTSYAGRGIELRDDDVIGLVPIGMNPVTRFWEFYDLRSAWDGAEDPASIPIPVHRADGGIDVTPATGIVFVLLPGGAFTMGAQGTDSTVPNFSIDATRIMGPPHEVVLAPFFLGKHEVTQGQWRRLGGGESSHYGEMFLAVGMNVPVTLAHPVETVDWAACTSLLAHHGCQLPTEAQWEYAARGGTSGPWSTGDEAASLDGYANVRDKTAFRHSAGWGEPEDFDDRHVIHAPVGSFLPNPFGLYDMHGNIAEWCLDRCGSYTGPVRAGDGLRLRDDGSGMHFLRGGSYASSAQQSESAFRYDAAATFAEASVGLRAARPLRRVD